MALQMWEAGRAVAQWAYQHPMPAAYAYTAVVATLAIPHYFPDVCMRQRNALDATTIDVTDIDTILGQIAAENHGIWVTGTDLRPDILGKIYYDNAINKAFPKSQTECEHLSDVINLYLAEHETSDWELRVYEGGVALNCSDWYDHTGRHLNETTWPGIIDAYLESELRRPPGEIDCRRPWSTCRHPRPSLSNLAPGSSDRIEPKSTDLRMQAVVTIATIRTVTVTVRGISSVTHSPGCPVNHNQPFSKHPTRTVPICSYTTITATFPVIKEETWTAWEIHHVIGTQLTPFSIDGAITTEREGYSCEFPDCATSRSVDWLVATTTRFYPKGYRFPTDVPGTTVDIPEHAADAPTDTVVLLQPNSSTEEILPTTTATIGRNDTFSEDEGKQPEQKSNKAVEHTGLNVEGEQKHPSWTRRVLATIGSKLPFSDSKVGQPEEEASPVTKNNRHNIEEDESRFSSLDSEGRPPGPNFEWEQPPSFFHQRVMGSWRKGCRALRRFFSMLRTVPSNMMTDIPAAMDSQMNSPKESFMAIYYVIRSEPEAVWIVILFIEHAVILMYFLREAEVFGYLEQGARSFWNWCRAAWSNNE